LILSVDNVTYKYKNAKAPVLEDVSAVFSKGDISAVTGPNGSGKTTLAKVIMGILKPQEGRVTISSGDGVTDISSLSLAETGRKIGYVMQDPARQMFSTTVREEMEYGLRNMGLDEKETEARKKRFLSYFDMEGYEETFPFSLSQGEKQRLVLAAVLAMEPEWLILDEPTASLDVRRKRMLGEYLLKIKNDLGSGIIIISHDASFVRRYAQAEIKMTGDGHV